ncbi:MAG: CPBP family glutamic-type intramembrane protease [Imperialibacter sp.]|uniref:CPBP family glutamic-type intramembrane protease n=1 Tax=Imperialibacter sp. TaxID=2038411 RepID=UPI0032EE5BB7
MRAQDEMPLKAADYLLTLDNSRDSLYKQVIVGFERYLAQHPEDVDVRLEHCELIGNAFYDAYDDYNPLEREYTNCVEGLISDFPTNHKVLLYQLAHSWGDSAITVANKILEMNRSDPNSWTNQELSIAYQKLANTYEYNGTPDQVIESAELAQSLNDTLDLTYLLAQQYEKKNLYSKATELLLSSIDSADDNLMSYNKAILLLELGVDKKALELFQLIQKDTTLYIDNGKIAQALIVNERYSEARKYLLRALSSSYDKSVVLHDLFVFDYQHSAPDTLLATYNQLMEESFHNDTFGKYRFMLLFKAPFRAWEFNDIFKLLLFLLLIVIPFSIPYIYVLPIDFISRRFGIENDAPALKSSNWRLTDFWIISSFVIVIDVLVWMIFNYPDLLSTFFNDMYVAEENKISLNQANQAIAYFFLMLIMTLGYLKKTDFQVLQSTEWKMGKSIGLGMLFAFIFRTIYFALARTGILPGLEASMLSSVMDYLKSINQYYHPFLAFLLAVVIVPFYEEFIFRGIILNSLDRRIKFIAANVIQSALFALLHENTSLFLFYFSTGIIVGWMVKKSNSLVPALSFHATNNFFAFIAIMRM